MRQQGKKFLIINTFLVYIASIFLQNFQILFSTWAAEKNIPHVNIVSVLVDDQIYDALKSEIQRYATEYIQKELPESKALVTPLNLENIQASDIHKMLENIYFDGLEEVNSSLIGLVLIGDIPLPVINENNYIFPSIYPYLDFLNQKYIRDAQEEYFVSNNNPAGQAEIRHGLINYEKNISEYQHFFQKIREYKADPSAFIGSGVWYEDFVANKNTFLEENLQFYQNKILFSEDIGYQRFTPLMLKIFQSEQNRRSTDILEGFNEAAVAMGANENVVTSIEENSLENDEAMSTQIVEKSIKEGMIINYTDIFSTQLGVNMRDNVLAGARSIKEYTNSDGEQDLKVNVDSSSSKILIKDTINIGSDNIQGLLINFNELLEESVDKKIAKENYDMDIVLPVSYRKEESQKKLSKCIKMPTSYEVYYFGKHTNLINNAKELSMYRGTFRNLSSLSWITESEINKSTNPSQSELDNTKWEFKSVGASYNIFSTQVEGNRGYNLLNAEGEYEKYNKEKQHANFNKKCSSYRLKIFWKWFFCRQYKNEGIWKCNPNDDDQSNDGDCETLQQFSERVRGGASPINLDFDKLSENGTYILKTFDPFSARQNIFDIAGSKKITTEEPSGNSYNAYLTYGSPTATVISNRNQRYTITQEKPTNHDTKISDLVFFNLNKSILEWQVKWDRSLFELNSWGGKCGSTKQTYSYKIISSLVKNVSTTDIELNGIDTTKYGENAPLRNYYNQINKKTDQLWEEIQDILEEERIILSGMIGGELIMNTIREIETEEITRNQSGIIISIQSGTIERIQSEMDKLSLNIQSLKESFQEQYYTLEGVSPQGIISIFESISYIERESLLQGKLDFHPDWIKKISEDIGTIREGYTNSVSTFKEIISKFSRIMTNRETSKESWRKTISYGETTLYDEIGEKNIEDLDKTLNNFRKITFMDYDENDNPIGETERDITESALNSGTFLEDLEQGHNEEDEDGIIGRIPWVKARLNLLFQENSEDAPIKIEWINLLTPDRPIDSPRYITFQGVWANEIKLIYPDIYKVEVFKENDGIQKLKTIEEITTAIEEYLKNKVSEYNKMISEERGKAVTNQTRYSEYYNILSKIDKKATPTLESNTRSYQFFSYEDFLTALWGSEQLEIIAELLYYQNLTNTEKIWSDTISEDLDNIKESFNINNKVSYVLNEYLTENNTKHTLNIPSYQTKGYEIWFFNSDGDDNIEYNSISNTADDNLQSLQQQMKDLTRNDEGDTDDEDLDFQEQCGVEPDGTALLFDLSDMSSPWLKALGCRWKKTLESPFKITLDYSESLGPVLPIWDASLKDAIIAYNEQEGNPLQKRQNAMEEYGDDRSNIIIQQERDNATKMAEEENRRTNENNQKINEAEGNTKIRLQEIKDNVKTSLSSLTFSEIKTNATLRISASKDIGTLNMSISWTGDACFTIEGKNLCTTPRSKTFNPEKESQALNITPVTNKAGTSLIVITSCLPNSSNCITRTHKITSIPWLVTEVEVSMDNTTLIAGIQYPLTFNAYDKEKNLVEWSNEGFTITASSGVIIENWLARTWITVYDLKKTKLYYKADKDTINNSNIQIQALSHSGEILSNLTQTVKQAKPSIMINTQTYPLTENKTTTITLKIWNTNSIYITQNSNRYLNQQKLQKVTLQLKDVNNTITNLHTNVKVRAKNKLVTIGSTKSSTTNSVVRESFSTQSLFEMKNGEVSFYFYPNTRAGEDNISIEIKGLDPIQIPINIVPSDTQLVEISFAPESIRIDEEAKATLTVKDMRGNTVPNATRVKLSSTESLSYNTENTIIISGGKTDITVKGIKGGIGYLITEIENKTESKNSQSLQIKESLIPQSWLNILYLNYFGSDRWNQRGYFSNNEKYIENIMSQSNKIISTTTQLVQEANIKEILRWIEPNFQIKNYRNIKTITKIEREQLMINIGNIAKLKTPLGQLEWIQTTSEESMNAILNSRRTENNIIFFIPAEWGYKIENGILSQNNETIADLKNGELDILRSNSSLNNGYQVWTISANNIYYGSIVFHLPKANFTIEQIESYSSRYTIGKTFSQGSTNNQNLIGIFDATSSFNIDTSYLSIQDSNTMNNSIGFRGDFKNMTLFAQGERVGEASKKFWSELLINLWDPLLKKYDENPKVYDTKLDGGIGEAVFTDTENTIFITKVIDFNNDGLKDLLIVYEDGQVKIAKNYGSEPSFKNLENLIFIAENIEEVHVGDIDGNQYEDIIILTKNKNLKVYPNRWGTFDVDGYPICLNTNVEIEEITDTPQDMSGIYQMFLEDMDKDGNLDIITNDNKGLVKIFYGGATKGYANYVSKEKHTCDNEWYERSNENTKIVTQYGIKLNESVKVVDNSMARREGLIAPENEIVDPYSAGVTDNSAMLSALSKMDANAAKNINMADIMAQLGSNSFDINQMTSVGIETALKYQELKISPTLTEIKESYTFIPISYLDENDNLKVYKTYTDINWGILQKGDKVLVEVYIEALVNTKAIFGDKIQGPWEIEYSTENRPKSLNLPRSKSFTLIGKNEDFNYIIDNLELRSGEVFTYSYELEYYNIQTQSISITDINWEDYAPEDINIQTDWILDIKLQPTNGCVKYIQAFVNTKRDKNRQYGKEAINLQKLIDNQLKEAEENDPAKDMEQQALDAMSNKDVSGIPWITSEGLDLKKLVSEGFNGGINIDLNLFDNEINNIQESVDKLAEAACRGYSFGGDGGNCAGIPVPFNQAFLAPGDYHLFWCIKLPLIPLSNGLPVFHFPGTLPTPLGPIPFPRGLKGPGDDFVRAPWGTYPSMIRIYVAPTLTAQVGVAVCLGPYSVGKAIPFPLSELGGNCIVTVIKPQCGGKTDKDNPEESYAPWTNDLSNGESCSSSPSGTASTKEGYSQSPFEMIINNMTPGEKDVYSPYLPSGEGGFGIFTLEMDTIPKYGDSNVESSLTIKGVKLEGGGTTKNRITQGISNGIRKILIDGWLDPQIKYLTNNLTKMSLSIKWPDFSELTLPKERTDTDTDNLQKTTTSKNINEENTKNLVEKYKQLSSTVNTLNDNIANPFEQVTQIFNESNIINIQTKNLAVKIPMIYSEDINSYGIYLHQRIDSNSKIISEREGIVQSILGSCLTDYNPGSKALSEIVKEAKEFNSQCANILWDPEIEKQLNQFIDFHERQFINMLDKINGNIRTLEEYKMFPFELYEWIHVIDRYMAEISAIINNLLGYLSYRMISNANRFAGYIDAIILIMNTIKTYQVLVDFSINWSEKCSSCTNDTYDQYACKLSLLCQNIELPIIQIPNFKIPDLILDFSDLNLNFDIVLPVFHFQPEKVALPNLPNLPGAPNLPNINIDMLKFILESFNINLWEIPELPSPPDLPEVPSFIPNIKLELPTIPPAPKIPALPNQFQTTLNLLEKIGKLYCTIKNGFGLIGEGSVKAKIEQLSQRTYEVKRFDNIVDLTNIQAKKPKLQGFDYEISVQTNIQMKSDHLFAVLEAITTNINNISIGITDRVEENPVNRLEETMNEGKEAAEDGIQQSENRVNQQIDSKEISIYMNDELEYTDYTTAKQRLEEGLMAFNTKSKDVATIQSTLRNIEEQIHNQSTILTNEQGIIATQQEISNLINQEQERNSQIKELLSYDFDAFLEILEEDSELTNNKEEKTLAFNTQLFNIDEKTEKILNNIENPYKILLDNKAPIIDGFLNAIETNNASDLNMSHTQYYNTKQQLQSMKNQIAGLYQRILPQQQTQLIAKNTDQPTQKTLTSQSNGTNSAEGILQSTFDPASYVSGIYVKRDSSPKISKVVYSETNAENIGKRYFEQDINNDKVNDLILRDNHSVYLKYGNQNTNFTTTEKYYSEYYLYKINEIKAEHSTIRFDRTTILKISDQHQEVKNFKVNGQTFDDISLEWKTSREQGVEAYLIKLTERVDHAPEKQEKINTQIPRKYVLVLNKYNTNTGLQIELEGKKQEIEKFIDKEIVEIVYFDPIQENASTSIEKIERKRQYAKIATLSETNNILKVSSPWSNQVVAGKQILGDNTGPVGIAEIVRNTTQESVSSGNVLEGYVGTTYTLHMHREDNIALATMEVEQNGKLIQKKDITTATGTISISNLFFTGAQSVQYIFYASDHYGNSSQQEVTLNINVPEITITNIRKEDSSSENLAIITAELSQDIDQGNVAFQRQRNNYRLDLIAKEKGGGNKTDNYTLAPNISVIEGKYYHLDNKVWLYTNDNLLIAEIDPDTGEVIVQEEFKDKVYLKINFVANVPLLQVYERGNSKLLFNITLPIEEFLQVAAPEYTITDVNHTSLGIFNGGKTVHKNWENILFISPTGQLYSEKGLSGEYNFDKNNNSIIYTLNERGNKNTIEVKLKVKSFE